LHQISNKELYFVSQTATDRLWFLCLI